MLMLRNAGNLHDTPVDVEANAASLFSEVEERRAVLENEHNQLAAKHKGLLRAHHQTVSQQERMRSHISRLQQITQMKKDEDRLKRLEATLQQRESENRELVGRLAALESSVLQHDLENEGHGEAGDDDSASVSTLRFRIASMEAQQSALQKELQTVRMLRLSEAEKLHVLERSLGDVEAELEQSRASVVRLKWELEQSQPSHSFGRPDIAPPLHTVRADTTSLDTTPLDTTPLDTTPLDTTPHETASVEEHFSESESEAENVPPPKPITTKRSSLASTTSDKPEKFKLVPGSSTRPVLASSTVNPVPVKGKSVPKKVVVARDKVNKAGEDCKQQ